MSERVKVTKDSGVRERGEKLEVTEGRKEGKVEAV